MVNAKRKENKLNPLFVHCIELANDSQHSIPEEEAKVSSSNKRMRVLGTLIKKPKVNFLLNNRFEFYVVIKYKFSGKS